MDDELEIFSWFSALDETSVIRNYQIQRMSDGALLLQAQARLTFDNLKTGALHLVPIEFLQDLEPNTVND